ncbi:kinase-like protein [Auricularia subglabra TFB-10046 SS5]|nr:kinase-like protein [Auricularia subglabra TFB-10046 SS5]
MLLGAFTFDGKPFTVSIPSLKPVGCGATAKVFVGQIVDNEDSQRVAVKVFGNMLEDHHQELLIRELRAARQVSISCHPSILPFIGSASFGLQTAIVSPYMRNGNLLEYFKAHDDIGTVDKKKLILQVAQAVNHLHTVEGLVHGDLKCANVLVSDAEDALLADFGLSTFVEKARTSPEILKDAAGQPARLRSKTRESDVYAFGMFILEAVTERPPWADSDEFAVMHWMVRPSVPASIT